MGKHDVVRAGTLGFGAAALVGAVWFALVRDGDGPAAEAPGPSATLRPADAPAGTIGVAEPDRSVEPAPGVPTSGAATPAVEPIADESPGGENAVAVTADRAVAIDTVPAVPEAGAPSEPSVTEGNLDLALDQRDLERMDREAAGTPVIVPPRYPASEAARYFVPREERRPGNLGGPPPLDFPGGPEDPGGSGFAPPAAPGE